MIFFAEQSLKQILARMFFSFGKPNSGAVLAKFAFSGRPSEQPASSTISLDHIYSNTIFVWSTK